MQHELKIKRVYEPRSQQDGYRILVDRLWPRGLSKATLQFDLWAKEIAPSPALRKIFGHQPERFAWFEAAYLAELNANPSAIHFAKECAERLQTENITLLFAAKDLSCNHVIILQHWIIDIAKKCVSTDDASS